MQQELIEMLEEIIQYVEVWNAHDQSVLDKAEALIEKAKNNAPAVQQGWKLVPVEPTEEMLNAACQDGVCVEGRPVWKHSTAFQAKWKYQQMLSASPSQEPAQEMLDITEADVWHEGSKSFYRAKLLHKLTPGRFFSGPPELDVYTKPVQEVTLTDEEICECFGIDGADDWVFKGARAIIAALRAKENKL